MSKYGKTIIGLTGNIATGKSVVRKMLQILGAYGIDADALSHRAIERNAPGYEMVLKEFGNHILGKDYEIDRKKLGQVVFSDADALNKLEQIVHPLVRQAAVFLIKNNNFDVVVIEAIKLLDSPLRELLDHIWVTTSSEEIQISRLERNRNINRSEALRVMANQTPQEDKIKAANTIILNDGSFEEVWQQVQHSWYEIFPEKIPDEKIIISQKIIQDYKEKEKSPAQQDFQIFRATPTHVKVIWNFIKENGFEHSKFDPDDIMASFGDRAYIIIVQNERIIGTIGWQVENLVSRVDEILILEEMNDPKIINSAIEMIEKESKDLQSEVLFVAVDKTKAELLSSIQDIGFSKIHVDDISVKIWREIAQSLSNQTAILYYKQLRVDRVMKPI